jgi:uncharacterized protein YrrD
MDIRLGMRVRASDGQHLGYVDRIILEPDSHEVFGIIAHKGHFFSEDRIIEVGFIESAADDTVRLRITGERADALPRFVEHEFVVPTPEQLRTMPYAVDGGVSGAGASVLPLMWRSTYQGHGFQPASRSFLDSSQVDAPSIEVLSNLPEETLLIDKGTDVIAQDGTRIGKVDDVIVVDGAIGGILIRAGRFHHHDISIPVEMIESVTPQHIRLNVSASDVKESPGSQPAPAEKVAG